MEQTKALNALEPFLALSKSATSPRAAVDLIRQATSAPNTFVFAELLQTPNISALEAAENPELRAHHNLLRIFSYGTYADYEAASSLPPLSDAQALKLRQLSLLSLSRDRSNLSYAALQRNLGLTSSRQVENLVITAVYAGLLAATLDPARQAVQVTSVAPLRDLSPGAIPGLTQALKVWSGRCTSTLADLDAQIRQIREAAVLRETEKRVSEDRLRKAVSEIVDSDVKVDASGVKGDLPARRWKRSAQAGGAANDETMDLDDPTVAEESKGRGSKRKM